MSGSVTSAATEATSGSVPGRKPVSWRRLMYEFTQETTLHGIKNTTAPTPFPVRRVIWAILVLGALAFFSAFLTLRFIYLWGCPKTVDVEVIYTDAVEFPAVTICNQNLFRTSATAELGLYDVVEESFRKALGIYEPDGFDAYKDMHIQGAGEPHTRYLKITSQVCKRLCEEMHSDSCCSLTFDRSTRTCEIFPLEHEAEGVLLGYKPFTDYYKRKKCQVQKSMACTFADSDQCNFVGDFTKKNEWRRVKPEDENEELPGTIDHTHLSARGHMMLASTKYPSPNDLAHLLSPYILSSSHTCMKFYYNITKGVLNVKMLKRKLEGEELLWSRKADKIGTWQKAYLKLPKGYYRLIFEATASDEANGLMITIDDIYIGDCQEQRCIESKTGSGYTGTQNRPLGNRRELQCLPWQQLLPYLYKTVWRYQNVTLTSENIREQQNFCRNHDSDPDGPWCFVGNSLDTLQMEYCRLPACGCRDEAENTCDHGGCIPRDLVCNGVDDCGDNSDELAPCNRTSTLECDFEHGWMCDYRNHEDFKPRWKLNNGTLRLDMDDMQNGEISKLLSPVFDIAEVSCLHIDYVIKGNIEFDIYLQTQMDSAVKRLCSLSKSQETTGWNSTDMMLPLGRYQLVLEAHVKDKGSSAVLKLDNITLLNENCTFDYEVILTSESIFDTTMVENSTWGAVTTSGLTTEMMTTEGDTMPQYDEDLGPHPPFVHHMCEPSSQPLITSEFRLTDSVCERTFRLYDSQGGVRSTCRRIEGRIGYSLDRCIKLAFELGGNIFEHRYEECYVRMCENPLEPQLTVDGGGWNIYVLESAEEDEGIPCTFTAKCGCGYNFTASNANFRWIRTSEKIDIANNATDNNTEFFTTVSLAEGTETAPQGNHWLRLISPFVDNPTNDSCLSFYYKLNNNDLTVYRVVDNERTVLIRIEHDGQRPVWHRATVSVPKGLYRLRFQAEFYKWPLNNFGLDNIKLEKGLCEALEEFGPMDCTFDNIDYCGYKDYSLGPYRWIRSRNNDALGNIPGVYYMRTSGHTRKKNTLVLKSPIYSYHGSICLSFHYFMHGLDAKALTALSLTIETKPGNVETVEWLVRSVIDNNWHFGQTSFYSDGPFQLIFRLTGKRIRGGVDHIMLSNETCPMFNCSMGEYECGGQSACIPRLNVCDGVANCYLADDEEKFRCAENKEPDVESEHDQEATLDKRIPLSEKPDPSEALGSDAMQLTLPEIYLRAGHRGRDFIYRCKFEGFPCDVEESFKREVTDYGVCYIFNHNASNPLKTAKTGSRFGLSLTINIEQYEYMLGPQSDAGIKVFLHSMHELPEVRDLGFAISPGSHALVGARLNEAFNLKPPYGDCGEPQLKYYANYSYSSCQRQCETDDVVDLCGCRDAYMPGFTIDNPPICNLSKFFSCALPAINSIDKQRKPCVCPKPCYQRLYEPSLSQAALSYLSVDKILRDKNEFEYLASRYHSSLEARQRVQEVSFQNDIRLISNVALLLTDMRRTGKTYLGDFTRSYFARVWESSTTLVKSGFQEDTNELFRHLHNYESFYEYNFQTYVTMVKDDALGNSLRILKQEIDFIARGYERSTFFPRLISDSIYEVDFAFNRIKTLHLRYTNRSYIEAHGEFLESNAEPVTFNVREKNCLNNTLVILRTLKELEITLQNVSISIGGTSEYNISSLQGHINNYNERYMRLVRCMDEYPNVLREVVSWKNEVQEETTDMFIVGEPFDGINYNYNEEVVELMKDETELLELLRNYSEGKITKLKYLETYSSIARNKVVLGSMDKFVEKIREKILAPLQRRLNDIYDVLLKHYVTALEKASMLEAYLPNGTLKNAGKFMEIWKQPEPRLDNPSVFEIGKKAYWNTWPQEISIHDFAKHGGGGPEAVNKALDLYCKPLIETITGKDDEFVEKQRQLKEQLERIDREYEKHMAERQVNHKFVLDNYLNMDVYFSQLKHQQVTQLKAYDITQFFGDVGGFMGLLLGASALTVCELIDLVIFNFAKKWHSQKVKDNKSKQPRQLQMSAESLENKEPVVDLASRGTGDNHSNGLIDYGFNQNPYAPK